MNEALKSELDDLNIALIFLNEARGRTQDLKKCCDAPNPTKKDFPDIDNRIARIQSSIDRFQRRANDITRIFKLEEAERERAAKG